MRVEEKRITCNSVGPPVHLSAINWWDGYFSIQIGIGSRIVIAYLEKEEWDRWLSELPALTAGKKRAAWVAGQLKES